MNLAVRKLGAVVIMAISMMLARGTSSLSSGATTRATTAIQVTARTQVPITPTVVTGADGYFWLAGTYPCASGTCSALMESVDGGSTWGRIGSAPMPTDRLVFANRLDGFASSQYFPVILYQTSDGGRNWHPAHSAGWLAGPVLLSGGRAYALSYRCHIQGCTSFALVSSPVAEDDWRVVTSFDARTTKGENPCLVVYGKRIWVFLVPDGGGSGGAVLVSANSGRSFSSIRPDPLATGSVICSLKATSASTIWGLCNGPHSSVQARSTDAGRHFVFPLTASDMFPGSLLYPLNDDEAVLLFSTQEEVNDQVLVNNLQLTSDGGQHFRVVLRQNVVSVAFAASDRWLAWSAAPTGVDINALWVTTDGGRTWQAHEPPRV